MLRQPLNLLCTQYVYRLWYLWARGKFSVILCYFIYYFIYYVPHDSYVLYNMLWFSVHCVFHIQSLCHFWFSVHCVFHIQSLCHCWSSVHCVFHNQSPCQCWFSVHCVFLIQIIMPLISLSSLCFPYSDHHAIHTSQISMPYMIPSLLCHLCHSSVSMPSLLSYVTMSYMHYIISWIKLTPHITMQTKINHHYHYVHTAIPYLIFF